MKRLRLLMSLLIVSLCFGFVNVNASTRVNTRTEVNYLVPPDVIVAESNKNAILSTPAVNAEEKIYDFADLLTDGEEEALYKHVKHFIDKTKIDYVIVTISKNNKGSSKDYTRDFYNYNNFGNDGIILLIDRDYKGIYMTTNGRAVELFPDSRMEPILKNVFMLTKEKKFFEACKSFTTSISEFVKIGVVSDDEEVVKVSQDGTVKVSKSLHLLEVSIFALVGTAIIIGILVLSSRMVRKATSASDFLNKDTMKIIDISEMFLGSRTFKAPLSGGSSNKNSKPKQSGSGIKE